MNKRGRETWLQTARRPSVVRRAVKVGVIVGTILAAINHGDAILSGALTPGVALKIALTYLVPYCVSTFAAVQALRAE